MAAQERDSDLSSTGPRHGCWLVVLTVVMSGLVLVVIGTVGLVGPRELVGVIVGVAAIVVLRDRHLRRADRLDRRGPP